MNTGQSYIMAKKNILLIGLPILITALCFYLIGSYHRSYKDTITEQKGYQKSIKKQNKDNRNNFLPKENNINTLERIRNAVLQKYNT